MDTLTSCELEQPHSCTGAPEILTAAVEQVLPVYQKCLNCPDLGRTCIGPHMSELGGTDAVRGYHRLLRAARNIPVTKIHQAAQHIGHGTINDYFGRSATQDFKLTTVLAIDRALVAICGNRVGQPPLEGFCPADAADLRNRSEALAGRMNEAEAEIARLTQLLADAEAAAAARIEEQRSALLGQIQLAMGQRDAAEARADDYLKRLDAKGEEIKALQAEIRNLYAEILRITAAFASDTKNMADQLIRLSRELNDDYRAILAHGPK